MSHQAIDPATLTFDDDGRTPNSALPVLVYRGLVFVGLGDRDGLNDHGDDDSDQRVERLEALFNAHGWPAQWRGGVFDFHHYHSVSHEVLGIYQGSATLQLGGESGEAVSVEAGDVVVLPAGTGHCCLKASQDFALTAGYPPDQQDWDICRSGEADHAAAIERIRQVAIPAQDPVAGRNGALLRLWSGR